MAKTKTSRSGKPSRRRANSDDASLTERAYTELEEQIVTLQLAPGAAVSEASLSKRLGIGRTPIREALQRLARERLVNVIPRRGIIVPEINIRAQLRLLEVRRELERLIARSAARRANDEQRREFDSIASGMERAAATNDEVTFMRLDRALNQALVAAAQNEFAAGAMSLMAGLARRFWYIHYKEVADMPLAARLHADVARAIAAGDQAGAAAASDKLMDYIGHFTRATVAAP